MDTLEELKQALRTLQCTVPTSFQVDPDSTAHPHVQAFLASDIVERGKTYRGRFGAWDIWMYRPMELAMVGEYLGLGHTDGGNGLVFLKAPSQPKPPVYLIDTHHDLDDPEQVEEHAVRLSHSLVAFVQKLTPEPSDLQTKQNAFTAKHPVGASPISAWMKPADRTRRDAKPRDVPALSPSHVFDDQGVHIHHLLTHPQGPFVLLADHATCRVWNTDTYECVHTLPLSRHAQEHILNIALSADGQHLAIATVDYRRSISYQVRGFSFPSLQPLWTLSRSRLMNLFLSPEGDYLVTLDDATGLILWDLPGMEQLWEYSPSSYWAAVHPDFRRFAIVEADDKVVSGTILSEGQWMETHTGFCTAYLSFSPDGSLFAFNDGMEIRLVSPSKANPAFHPQRSLDMDPFVTEIIFSPDGELFGLIGRDEDEEKTHVEVWSGARMEVIARFHSTPFEAPVTFSPDSSELWAIRGSSLVVYELPT